MNKKHDTVIEIEKTQGARLWSIFGFSAIMFYIITKTTLSKFERIIVMLIGIMTIITVGIAYIENEKRLMNVNSRSRKTCKNCPKDAES